MRYVDTYLTLVHPFYPLFHQQTLLRRLSSGHHFLDHGFFVSVAAACAFAEKRANCVDFLKYIPGDSDVMREISTVAMDTMPSDISSNVAAGLGYLRAYFFLGWQNMESGERQLAYHYLGICYMLVSCLNLQDESKWPAGIGREDREERRRVFWTVYKNAVFLTAAFKEPLKMLGGDTNVGYPEMMEEDGSPGSMPGWLQKWNATTDLYRILDHILVPWREQRQKKRGLTPALREQMASIISLPLLWTNLNAILASIPAETYWTDITGDKGRSCYQSANIQIVVQLIEIVSMETHLFNNPQGEVGHVCMLAEKVLLNLGSLAYRQQTIMSMPLVFTYIRLGTLLKQNMDRHPTADKVRHLLSATADCLGSLETAVRPTWSAAGKWREQIKKFDEEKERRDSRQLPSNSEVPASCPQQ